MAREIAIASGDNSEHIANVNSGKRLLVQTEGGAGSGTSETDDGAFTAGADFGTPAMGFFSTDTVDPNDVGVLAMDASRRLLVSIEVDNVGIGGGTQYTEDSVHNSGDTGTLSLVVRNDVITSLAGSDGDYSALQVDALGNLYTKITNANLVSTSNSTSSTLANGAVFTGISEDISMYASVSIQTYSSHASATNGLSMEFSTDGTNWDEKHTASVAAATEREFIFPAHAKYFRIIYTNGGITQTSFRLQTILHVQNLPGSAHTLDTNVPADAVGTISKSVIIAQAAGSGEFVPVQATAAGNLKVSIEEADTSASGLGKAIDTIVGASDVGVAMLVKHVSNATHLTTAEGDYDILHIDDLGGLQVRPEQHNIFDEMDVTTNWSVFNDDTINLATTKKHAMGTDALTFDKDNGTANTVFAGIQKTISVVDLGSVSPHDIIQLMCYLPTLTNVSYVFVRVGTDSSNYNEWRVEDTNLTAATFETLALNLGDVHYDGITGNGWNPTAITYIAVGVAFDSEINTLAGIVFDEISFHTNQHTAASLNAEVSSSVSSANINLHKIGGSVTDKGSGNVSNGSQRIAIATDDVNMAAIKTSVELLDNAIYVDDDDWSDSTSSHVLVGGLYQSTPQSITNGDVGPLAVNATGHLRTVSHNGALAVPVIDSYSHIAINLTTAVDQVLVSSAANKQIWVYGYAFTCGDADGQTVSLQDEDNVALTGIMEFAQYGGISVPPSGNFSMPIFKLGTDKDLEIDITNGDVDGWVAYAIVSV